MEKITSIQNPRIKQILQLSKNKERREQGLVAMEGARELGLALDAGYIPESIFLCQEVFSKSEYPSLINRLPRERIVEITPAVFDKLAYRENSDGLIALIKPKNHDISNLKISENPFIIILESVEKPGNLGAILRTADASKADAVIVCDPNTDLYNPNVIRSSVGCIFTVQVGIGFSAEILEWLKEKKIESFAAELTSSEWYQESDFTGPSAIIMGTEADGLTNFWLDNANKRIKIPMRGKIDSLNVSVSTAILTFEAMRQRGF